MAGTHDVYGASQTLVHLWDKTEWPGTKSGMSVSGQCSYVTHPGEQCKQGVIIQLHTKTLCHHPEILDPNLQTPEVL